MNRRTFRTLFATVLCLGALASPALAQINISVELGQAPPPPRHEVLREPRAGHVWIPGFWYWEGHRHIWAEGHWERVRPGRRWVPARWEPRGDMYHYEPGRWERAGRQGPKHHAPERFDRGEHRRDYHSGRGPERG